MLSQIRKKVEAGDRITADEGMYLLQNADLLDLAPLARTWRYRHNPEDQVTFVIDTNLNYTNLCDAYCSFCAFYRTDPNDPSAYTYTVEQIMEKIGRAADKGVTTVLMQGGLNSDLPLDYYTQMVSETVRLYPNVTPHYWSAPEIMKMCEVSGRSIRDVMQALWDAGQRTMPGGGSEILSNRVKAEISRFKPKDTVDQWTDVHVEAHRVGFQTTATMMYGHVETDEDIIESLEHIRRVQDQAEWSNGAVSPRSSPGPISEITPRWPRRWQRKPAPTSTFALSPCHGYSWTTCRTSRPRGSLKAERRARSPFSSARTISVARFSTKTSCSPPGSITARTWTR